MKRVKSISLDTFLMKEDTTDVFFAYYCGQRRFNLIQVRYCVPFLLMKLGILPKSSYQNILFMHIFRGTSYRRFSGICQDFAMQMLDHHVNIVRLHDLLSLQAQGTTVCIISHGLSAWVKPWCSKYGFTNISCNDSEVVNRRLTGRVLY